MKKIILTITVAFLTVPVLLWAQTSIVDDPCLVRVYHTNFPFPREGGVVVRSGDQLYFAKTYLAGCEDAADGLEIVKDGPDAEDSDTPGENFVEFFLGDPCFVPVYHADFVFPPEGGVVIRTADGDLFFVPTYLPGCSDADEAGTVIRRAGDPPVNTRPTGGPGGSVVDFLIGDPCLVPVYHTNFQFPPEGGRIETIDGQLYFVQDYLDGC